MSKKPSFLSKPTFLKKPAWMDALKAKQHLTTRQLREHLAEVLSATMRHRKKFVITKNGEPRIAVIPLEYLAVLEALDKHPEVKEMLKKRAGNLIP